MRKYLYLIKKAKIKSWLKFWLMTNKQFTIVLSEILEGFSFNLQNTVKRYFKIFNIFGNSVQDGTPTPSNPSEIHSVADDVNLFDVTNKTATLGGASYTAKNGEIIINGQSIQNASITVGKVYLKANTNYYFSYNNNNSLNSFYFVFNDHGTNIFLNQDRTFTVSQDGEYEPGFILISGTYSNLIIRPKFQKGTVATPYSPYNYGTFTIDFEGQTENYNYTFITEPLRSLPNGVRDSLEDDGIHRRVGRVILDGSEDWIFNDVNSLGSRYFYTTSISNRKAKGDCISNYFRKLQDLNEDTNGIFSGLALNIVKDVVINADEFKIWLSTHNTEVLYELETEVIEPYTEEQQEQYNKIKELYTFDGTTNIYSDDEVPPYLQIQYYMKGE